ncbi:aldolase [Aureimonas endophytica]|uniref:Aldolase n=1 Tax=Aureimonas endophytica TaxID=2027858 RepID=A0A917A307_9HYPH|nr:class II aldolase/adducin family protein [Aureimonas endophytica]GGE22704.1 aldolase [Aureimonas endophytica]
MSDTIEALRRAICDIGRRAWDKGMGAANDGNISVLLDDDTLLCTPTGVSKGFMTPDMICHIGRDGAPLTDSRWKPSTETRMHLCVYDARPDVRAVVHAHPLYATVHAICGKPLTQQIMPESTMFLGEVPLAPYGLPSTEELSDAIRPYLERHDAVLLENHGALSCGHDLQSAWFKMEALDYYAKVVYLAAGYGGAQEFDARQVERLIGLRRDRFPSPGRHPFITP